MLQYLLDFFRYNQKANSKILKTIQELPEPDEPVRLFSHLITSQDKWMNRITGKDADTNYHWFQPSFPIEELETRMNNSFENWLVLLNNKSEEELETPVIFIRPSDGKKMSVKLKDIALQLNYHSIHHRAQINTLIRQQGITPPATDYILGALSEL